MMLFWTLALLLALLASSLVLLPLWRGARPDGEQDLLALNRRVFRERLAELERDRAEGRADATTFLDLRTELERNMLSLEPAVTRTAATVPARRVRLAAMLLLPTLALGFYALVLAPRELPDWWRLRAEMGPSVDKIMRGEAPTEADARAHSLADFVRLLQDRLQRDPQNADGWFMLGVAYMRLEMLPPATASFEHAWRLQPADPRFALLYAQTRIFGNEGKLEPLSRQLLDQVLESTPAHEGALLLYGVAAQRSGDYATAVARLEALQRLRAQRGAGTASPQADELSSTLAEARRQLALAGSGQPAASQAGLQVRVRVAPALAGRYSPDDSLYIFARALGGPPMPLAVVRRRAGELPLTVVLDDSRSMLPQQPLSSVADIAVSARISRHGGPEPQPGDLEAVAVPVHQDGQARTLELLIRDQR